MSEETKVDTIILDDKKLWLICPKCKNFPLITLKLGNDTSETSIKLKCRCNKYNEEQYSIKEYFTQITEKQKYKMPCTKNPAHKGYLAINYCFQCKEFLCSLCKTLHDTLNKDHTISDEAIKIDKICDRHLKENEIVSYCNECNMNLCVACLKEHNIHHDIFELRSFFPKNLSDKYFEDFKTIQVSFFKYINDAKKILDEKIREKKDEEGIDQNLKNDLKNAAKNLNLAYEKNKQTNQDLIKLISYMFENYNNTIESSPNFNIIYELQNLTRFNNCIKQFDYDENISLLENINTFIDYLNKIFIIKTISTPLEIKEIIKIPKLNNTRVLLSIGGSRVCSGNWESNIQILDINTKTILKTIAGHFSGVNSLCLINGQYILSGGCDAAMNIYDPSDIVDENKNEEEGESCYRGFINGHDDTVSKIIQFKDGKVATCGFDKKINIFGKLLNNEAKEDFPVIELTEEEKEKLEKEKLEKEKQEKLEKEKQEKLEKLEKEKQEKENKDKDKDKDKDKEKKENENENNENENKEKDNKQEEEKPENEEPKKELYYISFEKLTTFELPNKVFDICELKDGSLIACCLDKTLRIYNMETLKEEKMIQLNFVPSKIASLTDGRIVVGFGEKGSFGIKIFKLNDKKELILENEFITHTKSITSLIILEDGKIATTSLDGTAAFYNPYEMKVVCQIEENKKKNFTSITQLEDRSVVISSTKGFIYVLH